jgi:hypothetical protein
MTVVFQVDGIAYGAVDGEVAVAGATGVGFTQYMLP